MTKYLNTVGILKTKGNLDNSGMKLIDNSIDASSMEFDSMKGGGGVDLGRVNFDGVILGEGMGGGEDGKGGEGGKVEFAEVLSGDRDGGESDTRTSGIGS